MPSPWKKVTRNACACWMARSSYSRAVLYILYVLLPSFLPHISGSSFFEAKLQLKNCGVWIPDSKRFGFLPLTTVSDPDFRKPEVAHCAVTVPASIVLCFALSRSVRFLSPWRQRREPVEHEMIVEDTERNDAMTLMFICFAELKEWSGSVNVSSWSSADRLGPIARSLAPTRLLVVFMSLIPSCLNSLCVFLSRHRQSS